MKNAAPSAQGKTRRLGPVLARLGASVCEWCGEVIQL